MHLSKTVMYGIEGRKVNLHSPTMAVTCSNGDPKSLYSATAALISRCPSSGSSCCKKVDTWTVGADLRSRNIDPSKVLVTARSVSCKKCVKGEVSVIMVNNPSPRWPFPLSTPQLADAWWMIHLPRERICTFQIEHCARLGDLQLVEHWCPHSACKQGSSLQWSNCI